MKRLHLKYGREMISPDLFLGEYDLLTEAMEEKHVDEVAIIEDILAHPIASPNVQDFVSPSERLAIIVPDKTRRCRTDLYLPILLQRIESAGVRRENISIIFANGTHAAQSEKEKRALIGDAIYDSYTIIEHDAKDEASMVFAGKTIFGTDVRIHPRVADADKIIATGTIVHHYFAGVGGGAKLLMPGVAAYSTAVQNHRRTLTEDGEFHPMCRDAQTSGNPVYEDIADAVRFYPPIFYFAVHLDEHGSICDGVCGDLRAAHDVGIEKINAMYLKPITKRYDLVVVSAGGYPKDINFIQAHKSIQHAFYAVKDAGVIICLAECEDGIGNAAFLDWFRYKSFEEFRSALLSHYTMNGHTALSLMNKTKNATIIFVSSLDERDVVLMQMKPARDIEDALKKAREILPEEFSTLIVENGSRYVPKVEGKEGT